MGLAISQSLVGVLNNHREGTEIKIDSEPGVGSTFQFLLFSCSLENKSTIMISSAKSLSVEAINEVKSSISPNRKLNLEGNISEIKTNRASSKANLEILIVDDDQINILVLTAFLKGVQGVTFKVANNGCEAVDIFEKNSASGDLINIILMDCNMPGLNGYQATRRIKEIAAARNIEEPWIIACTANASETDFRLCFESGMKDYLSKPFTKKDLVFKLDSYRKQRNNKID